MDILLKPDSLSLTGSMNHFVISSTQDVTFILKYADSNEVIVQHIYTPNKAKRIEVDLENIITPLLSFQLQESTTIYRQPKIAREFLVELKEDKTAATDTWQFVAIRAGIDNFADTASSWLKRNFLTWQPTVKPVTYYTPEFLSYYAVEDCVAKCRAYVEENGSYAQSDLVLGNLSHGKVWTMPMQYGIIAGKLGKMPSYYDVWVEDAAGTRLTYIQRYYASDIRSDEEQWVLFENSLGGIDTFRAYGDAENTAKHTHNVAEIENDSEEYRVDTVREYKKNTGFLSKEERKWLLDFFPSLGKFLYTGNYVRRIVVTESDVSWHTTDLPSSYTFTYKYADARPYLNIARSEDDAPAMLDIKIPEVGSFSIAPRLVEFERLPLSSGALFPVQSPYSDKWNITSAAAILEWFSREVTAAYKNDGAFGHRHDNMSVLNALDRIGGYLTLDAQKILAGLADEATSARTLDPKSADWEKIVRTDKDTLVNALTTFLRGFIIGNKGLGIDGEGNAMLLSLIAKELRSNGFRSGLVDGAGFGMYLDEGGKAVAEVDKLWVRDKATFAELEYRRLAFSAGDVGYTRAGAKLDMVVPQVNEQGAVTAYRCYFLADDGERRVKNDFRVGDQAACRTDNLVARQSQGKTANRRYWRLVTGTGNTTIGDKEYHYVDLANEPSVEIDGKTCVGYDQKAVNDEPQADDKIIQLGSQTDKERQYAYIIYTSEGKRVDYAGIDDYDLERHVVNVFSPKKISLRSDSLDIVTAAGTGESSPVVCDRGEWVEGVKAGRYDRFSYGGELWLCNVAVGKTTMSAPSEDSPDWKKDGSSYMRVVGDLRETVSQQGSSITSVQQDAKSLTLKVDSLKTGIRNLLDGGRYERAFTSYGFTYDLGKGKYIRLEVEKDYTLTVCGRISQSAKDKGQLLHFYVFDPAWKWHSHIEITNVTDTIASLKFRIPAHMKTSDDMYMVDGYPFPNKSENGGNGEVTVNWVTVTEGSQAASDWIPSKEESGEERVKTVEARLENGEFRVKSGRTVFVDDTDKENVLIEGGKLSAALIDAVKIVAAGLQAQKIDAGKATIKNLIVDGDSQFKGELDGVSGSFRSLDCRDEQGEKAGGIDFRTLMGKAYMGFRGDFGMYGYVKGYDFKRFSNFYATNLYCTNQFGHYSRVCAVIRDEEMFVYPDGRVDSTGIRVRLRVDVKYINGVYSEYYKIPLFYPGFGNEDFDEVDFDNLRFQTGSQAHNEGIIIGIPIDVVVFNCKKWRTFQFVGMSYGKQWTVINGNDEMTSNICCHGGAYEVRGGYVLDCCYVNPAWLSPSTVDQNSLGAGVMVGRELDMNWG